MKNVLVIGAAGQIGSELVPTLRAEGYSVVAGFSRTPLPVEMAGEGPSERIDILDGEGLVAVIRRHRIDTITTWRRFFRQKPKPCRLRGGTSA